MKRPEKIKLLRHQAGLSQTQLATRLELNVETVRRYEQGRGAIPIPYELALEMLAKDKADGDK